MRLLSDYDSRCRNKFLRIDIGIAPADEAKMNGVKLRHLVSEFIQTIGLEKNQTVAVTHKDTDNQQTLRPLSKRRLRHEAYKKKSRGRRI